MKLSTTFTSSLLFVVAISFNVVDVVQGSSSSSSSSSSSVGGGDISIICTNSDAAASITTEMTRLQEALVSNECWLNTTITDSIHDDGQPTSASASTTTTTTTTEECNNADIIINNNKERQMVQALPPQPVIEQEICDVSNVNFIVDVVHRARRMLKKQQRYYPYSSR